MWLRDHLPEQAPNSRVMVYGYNAKVFGDAVSTARLGNFAETFLEKLRHIRQRDVSKFVPVINRDRLTL